MLLHQTRVLSDAAAFFVVNRGASLLLNGTYCTAFSVSISILKN
jgi:hypothetical protein